MIFDPTTCCACAAVQELQGEAPLTLSGEGLWAGVLSSGQCVLECPGSQSAAGSSGDLLLGFGTFTLRPVTPCHLLCVRLTGLAVQQFLAATKLNNARMNVSNARVSSRFIRYIRVAAPCICFVPWAALASCRPRPQQQLPVSATGGGRCRCSSPSRLRAGYFQKKFPPGPLLVLCRNRKTSDTG